MGGCGTGIELVPVTPLMGDKYKYKPGGMEWQDELDLNHYDFGARNGASPERSFGNPALGRWMNIDPLAELMGNVSDVELGGFKMVNSLIIKIQVNLFNNIKTDDFRLLYF